MAEKLATKNLLETCWSHSVELFIRLKIQTKLSSDWNFFGKCREHEINHLLCDLWLFPPDLHSPLIRLWNLDLPRKILYCWWKNLLKLAASINKLTKAPRLSEQIFSNSLVCLHLSTKSHQELEKPRAFEKEALWNCTRLESVWTAFLSDCRCSFLFPGENLWKSYGMNQARGWKHSRKSKIELKIRKWWKIRGKWAVIRLILKEIEIDLCDHAESQVKKFVFSIFAVGQGATLKVVKACVWRKKIVQWWRVKLTRKI